MWLTHFLRRLFELRADDGVMLESSEKLLQPLRDVGEQNCLAFSNDGTKFATGGEVTVATHGPFHTLGGENNKNTPHTKM